MYPKSPADKSDFALCASLSKFAASIPGSYGPPRKGCDTRYVRSAIQDYRLEKVGLCDLIAGFRGVAFGALHFLPGFVYIFRVLKLKAGNVAGNLAQLF